MIVALLLASAVPSVPPRLDCLVSDDSSYSAEEEPTAAEEPTALTVTLVQRGDRLVSVVVDGPPLFSSTVGLSSFSGAQRRDGSIAISEDRAAARDLQWRGRIRGGSIELVRPGMRMTLLPDATAPGTYSGDWTMNTLLQGHFSLNAGGSIRCTAPSVAAAGGGS